ncbi:MAG: peptidylprolyl isomerase [Herminiimonas sp.]|nr:peptidylprolyl isomerase [Herminiimonas sp.]
MKTSLGDTVLELYPNNAPITVNNFLQYVSAGFYTNLIFHRVFPNFVIQGGGFNASLQQAVTRSAIKLEASNGLSNLRGTIAMARTSVADSATSQFFINTVDNVTLDTSGGGYAVFGKVVSGLTTVVDKIAAVPTTTVNGVGDVPVTPVVITSTTQTQ